jgi:hypothetical protein
MIGKYIFRFIFISSMCSAVNAQSNFPTDALCRNPKEYFSQSTAINPYIIFHLEEYTLKHISKTVTDTSIVFSYLNDLYRTKYRHEIIFYHDHNQIYDIQYTFYFKKNDSGRYAQIKKLLAEDGWVFLEEKDGEEIFKHPSKKNITAFIGHEIVNKNNIEEFIWISVMFYTDTCE